MVIKKSQTTSKSSAKTAKSSVKKNATGNITKTVKKAVIKKPIKTVKAAVTKLPGIKAVAKSAATESGSGIKKPIKTIEGKKTKKIAAKKPDKTSAATAKGKKALSKEPISISKSETQGKKPLKKSPAKLVNAKSSITQKKTIKPLSIKKPSAQKVTKVVAAEAEGKTDNKIKAPAKTVSTAKAVKKTTVKTVITAKSKVTPKKTIKPLSTNKPSAQKVSKGVAAKAEGKTAKGITTPAKTVTTAKKAAAKATPQKTIKPVSTKKPSAQKAGKVVAAKAEGKTDKEIKAPAKTVSTAKTVKKSAVTTGLQKKPASSNTTPQIKKPVQQNTVLKPKKKTEAPLSTIRKTVKTKVAPPLITEEPLPAINKKTTPAYTTPPREETISKKAAKLKVFLPEEELPPEEVQPTPSPQLPQEYGENELLLMEVDPSVVFVSWEIKPEDISSEAGNLVLRVYDVTGIDFDGTNANRIFDISLRNRAGSKFIDIKMPGRDVIMDIGLLDPEDAFKTIKRSNRVSMPALQTFDELDIAGSLSDSETLIGY